MELFATEFPVQQSSTSAKFAEVVREWLLGSPYTRLTEQNLAGLGEEEE